MRVMQMLDVSGATANTYDSGDLPTGFTTTACNTLYLINMSDLCYNVTFTGGTGLPVIGHLPNNWARPFKVTGNYDRFRITGSNNPTGAGTPAFSHIVVESYYANEDVTHLSDTPIPVPNTPSVNVTTAQYLKNSQDLAATNIIDVKPQGSTFPAIEAYNDGTVQINDPTGPTNLISCYPNQATGTSSVQLADVNHLTEIMGGLKVDGAFTINGITSAATFDLILNCSDAAHAIRLEVAGATVMSLINNLITANQPFQVSTVQSASGTSLVITTKNTADQINLQSNGTNVLSILTNMIVAAQPIQATSMKSPSGSNLTLDTTSSLNNLVLNNGGVNELIIFSNAMWFFETFIQQYTGISMQAGSGHSLIFDTSATSDQINLRNNGANVLNVLNNAIQALQPFAASAYIQPNAPAIVGNGSVSGSAQMFCPVWGSGQKIASIYCNNYNTASNIDLIFPSPINNAAYYHTGDAAGTYSFLNGASVVTCRHMLTLGAAGAAGTSEGITVLRTQNMGTILGPFDRIRMLPIAGSGWGVVTVIGS